MPYQSVSDLPAAIREKYGPCSRAFISAFNSTHDKTGSESRSFAVAHAAAKRCRGKESSMALDAPAVAEVKGPQFQIISKEIQPAAPGDDGRRRFRLTASSTIEDSDGDEIELAALQKAAEKFRSGVTIFMNHKFKDVSEAFGLTDSAEVVQRGYDPKTNAAIWDLDVSGVVNTPNPKAAQLADSIDGGYVKLGASITAFVRKHARKPNGGLKVADMDVIEASVVGVPSNQRSWAHKAALAIKSFNFQPDDEEDTVSDETETTEATEAVASAEVVEKQVDEPAADAADDEATTEAADAAADTGDHADDESAESSDPDVQESESETPETTSTEDTTDADPPMAEKALSAASPDEIAELVKQAGAMVAEIGRLRTENAELRAQVAKQAETTSSISKEVAEAQEVIQKVMGMPLQPRAAAYVADFTKAHPVFAPEVTNYLSARSRLNHE